MRTHVSALPLAAAALLVATVGCTTATGSATASTQSTASTESTGSTASTGQAGPSASPGHDTPQDAVAGVINAELSGDVSQLCSYLSPNQRSSCVSLKQSSIPTGKINVDGALISGDLALVEVTGRICITGNGCPGNANPSAGMPTGSETFKQAYDNALNGSAFSPVPCIKINGKWYVNSPSQ